MYPSLWIRLLLLAVLLVPAVPTHAARPDHPVYLPLVSNGPATRPWPDTTSGIFVFDDQIDVRGLSEAQWQFIAAHDAGAQKLTRSTARHLRQYNPNFLVLHYRLGQALGYRVPNGSCQPTGSFLQIISGDQWVQEWPGDSQVQEQWFFHWNGQRVYNCAWGHYLMDLNNPAWRAWWSAQVIQQL
ncbi:MAG TPA: hypothetical protein VMT46_09605 [Anaerolineaceae bacterium]|nr:hypothetical protein [Anaerolineaceae bacterium]